MLERSLKQVRNFAGGINGGSHGDISAGPCWMHCYKIDVTFS